MLERNIEDSEKQY